MLIAKWLNAHINGDQINRPAVVVFDFYEILEGGDQNVSAFFFGGCGDAIQITAA